MWRLLAAAFLLSLGAPAVAQEVVAWLTQPIGTVEVRRAEDGRWTRVSRSHVDLHRGDEVRTRAQSRAIILLRSAERVRLGAGGHYAVGAAEEEEPSGVGGLIAGAWDRLVGRPEPEATGAARDAEDDSPILERPRYGRVLSPRPTFQWLSVPSHADGYRVRVLRDTTACLDGPEAGPAVWERASVADTTLQYPEDQEPLRLGEDYVVAVNRAPDPEALDWGCFTVATDAERGAMEETWRALRDQYAAEDETEVTAELLYAAVLLDGGYYADALHVLDAAEMRAPGSAARLRAYVYEEAGPPLLVTPSP